MPRATNGFSIKPLKVMFLAGEQKATEFLGIGTPFGGWFLEERTEGTWNPILGDPNPIEKTHPNMRFEAVFLSLKGVCLGVATSCDIEGMPFCCDNISKLRIAERMISTGWGRLNTLQLSVAPKNPQKQFQLLEIVLCFCWLPCESAGGLESSCNILIYLQFSIHVLFMQGPLRSLQPS